MVLACYVKPLGSVTRAKLGFMYKLCLGLITNKKVVAVVSLVFLYVSCFGCLIIITQPEYTAEYAAGRWWSVARTSAAPVTTV